MSITWNTGIAAERARHNLKLKKKKRPAARKPQAASAKLQAPSLTVTEGYNRMSLKGIIMSINSNKETNIRGEVTQLRRIADAIEEILRIVKKDMEPRTKKKDE